MRSFDKLAFFDPVGNRWRSQTTTFAPSQRDDFCAVVYRASRAHTRYLCMEGTIWCYLGLERDQDTFTKNYFAIQASNNTNTTNNETPLKTLLFEQHTCWRIAGGVVGGLAGLALIATAVWFFLRRRTSNRRTLSGRSKGALGRSAKLRPS
ncbi:unnamed protein product [Clonostachys rosea f. rosea IK726]|uniref:Uncharacterized protein n=1 Tax=Clonostachys rosea f. rosea IK726 TaxID=1349383 RepID=A0ACA9UIM4_BIOOC|nr:unnamed protein product [Clonostachys rosea f. rosea IK726]